MKLILLISPQARLEREAEEKINMIMDKAYYAAIACVRFLPSLYKLILFFSSFFDVLRIQS